MAKKMQSYASLKGQLLSRPGPVLPPAPSAPSPEISHAISSLLLHPCIETALHLLNDDLPSAHFLVRHMQAAPQYEAMMLHGILHRIEGDYDNTRAWYSDVKDSDVFRHVWGDDNSCLDKALEFVGKIEVLRKEKKGRGDAEEVRDLEEESKREIQTVMEFCERKFGTKKVDDASGCWAQDEKSKSNQSAQLVGGEGFRQF